MNIMMLGPDYPPFVYGGVGTHIHTLSEELSKRGHRILVVCLGIKKILSNSFEVKNVNNISILEFQNDNIQYIELINESWDYRVIYNNTRVALTLYEIMNKYNIEIIHIHDHFWAIALEIIKSKRSIPTVVSFHSLSSSKDSFQDILRRYLFYNTEAVIVVSNYLKNQIVSRYGSINNIVTVYNGISYESSYPQSKKNKNRICYCGRISEKKGVDLLINAMIKIKKEIPKIELLLVGTGDEEKKFREEVDRLSLYDCIRFVGYVQPEKVSEYISTGIISIIPSRFEAFGLAALEAMRVGNCVIASDVGGLPELIKSEWNGILFKNGDTEDLAHAIIELLQNEEKQKKIIEHGYETLRFFSECQMTDKIESIYKQVKRGEEK